jgi:hypothetical protein
MIRRFGGLNWFPWEPVVADGSDIGFVLDALQSPVATIMANFLLSIIVDTW